MNRLLLIFLMGTGLLACSPVLQKSVIESRTVIKEIDSNPKIDSLIAPYSKELAKTMNEVIGYSERDLTVSRPNSNLGHWICDQLIEFAQDSLNDKSTPVISLLNTGGIRSPLLKGNITVGDVFKVMPFDNQITIVKIKIEKAKEINDYILKNGGEPIAGFKFYEGKIELNQKIESPYIYVVTSDYLASGGDKMTFFNNPEEIFSYSTLIRDYLIAKIRLKNNIIQVDQERIKL